MSYLYFETARNLVMMGHKAVDTSLLCETGTPARRVHFGDIIKEDRDHDTLGMRHPINTVIGTKVLMPRNNRTVGLFDVIRD